MTAVIHSLTYRRAINLQDRVKRLHQALATNGAEAVPVRCVLETLWLELDEREIVKQLLMVDLILDRPKKAIVEELRRGVPRGQPEMTVAVHGLESMRDVFRLLSDGADVALKVLRAADAEARQ